MAYERFPETSRDIAAFFFLGVGAVVFYFGTVLLERGSEANGTEESTEGERAQALTGRTIVLGRMLDTIPGALVLGMSLAFGGSVNIAFLVSILITNLPISIGTSSAMECGGMSRRKIYTTWLEVMVVCIIMTLVGVVLIEIAPYLTGVYVSAAAGGSLLGMLAITMIPEGYQEGGRLTALWSSWALPSLLCSA